MGEGVARMATRSKGRFRKAQGSAWPGVSIRERSGPSMAASSVNLRNSESVDRFAVGGRGLLPAQYTKCWCWADSADKDLATASFSDTQFKI